MDASEQRHVGIATSKVRNSCATLIADTANRITNLIGRAISSVALPDKRRILSLAEGRKSH